MLTTESTPSQTIPTETPRGFPGLHCFECGHEDSITVSLADMDTLTCTECDSTFTRAELRDQIGRWSRVLDWLDAAPPQ